MNSLYGNNSYPQVLYDKPFSNCSMLSDSYLDMFPCSYPCSTSICNTDNIEECIMHLNKLLQNMCLPTINHMSNSTVPLVNISFDLLKRTQQDTKFREELETKMSRIVSDYDRLQTLHLRSNDDNEKLEREIAIRQVKEKDLETKIRSLWSTIKAEKDELKRLNSTINHREIQYRHDFKKNEREMNRLKEKLSQALMEKNHKILGPEMLNALPKSDSKRATWKTNSNQVEELYSMMLRDYEKKLKNLHTENHDLENCMEKMVQSLESVVDQCKLNNMPDVVNEIDPGSLVDELDVAEGNTAYDPSESGYETYMSFTKCQKFLRKFNRHCITMQRYLEISIKEAEKSSDETFDAERETQLDLLKTRIQHYKEIVSFQEETLQNLAEKTPAENSSNSFLHETQLMQEYDQLEIKKKLFLEAKEKFEKERLQHMNEAVQLAEEKKRFNQQKCDKIKQQFLEWSPMKKSNESFSAFSELFPASSSGDTKSDSCSTPNRSSIFKNSTPYNEQPRCNRNLASGDASQVMDHQGNSLLDYSNFILDNVTYSQADSKAISDHNLLSSSNPMSTTQKCQSCTASSLISVSNNLPCSSASVPSCLNSEHSDKEIPSTNLSKSLTSSKILTSKALRNHYQQQRRLSDPVCSVTNKETSSMITSSFHSSGDLQHKTYFINLNSPDNSLLFGNQFELQIKPQSNSFHNVGGPCDP